MARERETERGKGGIREETRPKDIGIIFCKGMNSLETCASQAN